MTVNEFKLYTTENIKNFLSEDYKNATVEFRLVDKLNESYEAMTVRRPEFNCTPQVNFSKAYQNMLAQDLSAEEAVKIMANSIMKHESYNFSRDMFVDYDNIKERLFVRVSNAEKNKKYLETVPYMIDHEFAITCHILFSELQALGEIASTPVTNHMLGEYDVSTEQLFADAFENSERVFPAKLMTLADVVGLPDMEENPFYILTNKSNVNGAAVFFYHGMLEKIEKKIGSDYYMLPSSVHEVLIVPGDTECDPSGLSAMVATINSQEVDPEERLCDNAYFYDASKKQLTAVAR